MWILLESSQILRLHNGRFELGREGAQFAVSAIGTRRDGTTLFASLTGLGILTFDGEKYEVLASQANNLPTRNSMIAVQGDDDLFARFNWATGVAQDRVADSAVVAIAEASDRKIWMATPDHGFSYLFDGRLSRVAKGTIGGKTTSLLPLDNGEMWIGTDKGVLRWDGAKLTQMGIPASLRRADVHALLRGHDSSIWVGTAKGLIHANRDEILFDAKLPGDSGPVTALFEDREGNLWVGRSNGIERLRSSLFATYPVEDGRSESGGPVYVDEDGRAWFAPLQGSLHWLKGAETGTIENNSLSQDVVYSIAGKKNEVWIGRQHGGLTRLAFGPKEISTRAYTVTDGLAQNSVYAVYVSQDGAVWSGTLNSGVSKLKDDHFTNYTKNDGLISDTVSSIAEGTDGSMWFGTPEGLSQLSKNGWRNYAVRDGLTSPDVTCLLEDSTGVLWIGTSGGLSFLREGSIQTPRGTQEWLREPVFGMAQDSNGGLWIATRNRVLRAMLNRLTSGQALNDSAFRFYGQDDGLRGTEGVKRFRSVVKDAEGNVWFSTSRGLSVVNPYRSAASPLPALLHIEAARIDGREVNLGQSIRVTPDERRIVFDYVGLSLASPERIRYRYRLEGFDRGWSETVSTREATFDNLSPGTYRFRVICSNSDGIWNSEDASIEFSVLPAFYQTNWFRLACIAGFLALLWGVYQMRVHHLQEQERKFRDTVETMPALAFVVDRRGNRTFFNRGWLEYTGLSSEQASGSGWEVAVHPDDLKRVTERWRESQMTGEPLDYEARLRGGSDGVYRWFQTRARPLRDNRGKIVKWCAVANDIEDRRHAEELQAELAHTNRVSTLGELAASISHELKQPICAAVTYAQTSLRWLNRDQPDLDEARRATAESVKDGVRAANIIDRLGSLFKKTPPQRESVDVDEIIGEIVLLLRGEANRYDVSIRTDLAADLPKITADRVQLQQVLMNLMLNGIQAMKETGGVLTVKTGPGEGGQVLISVSDTGVGLPAGRADEIFNAFFTTKTQGTGMGLAISRSIVESHGGRLWATSHDGRGATFHFTLPTAVVEVSAAI
ncbi:two-component regulator propeller domain-containing protein [Edaphobacter modestus]|uniref:two-component regulator propeller domain-containing protein n=1 Tax=Edaphobacter modestus TaxID=388466 RepID=UPI001F5E4D3E|nr:two-component regulator propeller domain-containing protein [Edaphobacter modestus]